MDRQQVRNIVMEVLREEKRKGTLGQSASVLDVLPDIIDTVEIDKKYLYHCVKKAFRRSNPINGILGIFGLRLIREDDAQRLVHDDSANEEFANSFKVNEKELRKLVSSASMTLTEIERKNNEKEAFHVAKINELTKKLESEQMNYSQSCRENEMAMAAVADRLQFAFSQIGQDHMDDPVAAQLNELLTDLGMEMFWSADHTAVSEGAMFQFLKIDEPANHRMKPCIIQDHKVIAQGVIFVADSDDDMKHKTEE